MTDCIFAFDLDGTITQKELLPLIAARSGLQEEIAALTAQTLRGEIPFSLSLQKRVAMLGNIPLKDVQDIVNNVPLDPDICAFIQANSAACAVVTGNLDCWVRPLLKRLGCRYFCTKSVVVEGVIQIERIADKAEAIAELRKDGAFIVAVGESVSDIPMLRAADLGIAFGGVHAPLPKVRRIARRYAPDGASLCRMLQKLSAGSRP